MTDHYHKHCYVLLQLLYVKLNQWKQMKLGSLAFIKFICYVNLPEMKRRIRQINFLELNSVRKIDPPYLINEPAPF